MMTQYQLNQVVVMLLSLTNLILISFIIRALCDRPTILSFFTFTVAGFLLGYIISTVPLFVFDCFSVMSSLVVELIATCFVLWLIKKRKIKYSHIDWSLDKQRIIILLLVIAGLLSWHNFGYFGMGQDQGVYQVKAINLIYGETDRVFHFDEYEGLNTREKMNFTESAINQLRGLDNIDKTIEESSVLPKLTGTEIADHEAPDGIFHGIPTFPAALALFGTVFGIERMAYFQTVVFMLTIGILWLTGENLELKTSTKTLICLIYLLSPEVLWVSKSTLIEGCLGLIITLFLFFLTERVIERRWWSSFIVLAISVFHVSIYVMIPMFFTLYTILYLWEGDRQYIKALVVSAVSFMIGFSFMVIVAPRYSIRNTQQIWVGPINLFNIYPILMCLGLAGLVLAFLLRKIPVNGAFQRWVHSSGFSMFFRGIILFLLALSVVTTIKQISKTDLESGIVRNGLYNMIWMSGLITLPLTIGYMLYKPQKVLNNGLEVGLTFIFDYAILLMCSFMKADISFCYYYGRYLAPYIPIICIVGGRIWNCFSDRTIITGSLAGLLMLPFDGVLVTQDDDTRSSYDAISRITDAITIKKNENMAVIIDPADLFYLPVRAITGDDCYFAEENLDEQEQRLSQQYDYVCLVTTKDLNDREELTSLAEVVSMDDNVSNRVKYCPFPVSFPRSSNQYHVYDSLYTRNYNAEQLYTTGTYQNNGSILLKREEIQFGPYIELDGGKYLVEYTGENLDRLEYRVTANRGTTVIPCQPTMKSSERSVLYLNLPNHFSELEFFSHNISDEEVVIHSVVLKQIQDGTIINQIADSINTDRVPGEIGILTDDINEMDEVDNIFYTKEIQRPKDKTLDRCDVIITDSVFDTEFAKGRYDLIAADDFYFVFAKNENHMGLSNSIPKEILYCSENENGMNRWFRLKGFSEWEDEGKWTMEENSTIEFFIPEEKDYEVMIEPYGQLPELDDGYDISISVNGKTAFSRSLTPENADQPLSFVIEKEQLSGRINEMTVCATMWSPADYGSSDDRELGYSIKSIRLKELE